MQSVRCWMVVWATHLYQAKWLNSRMQSATVWLFDLCHALTGIYISITPSSVLGVQCILGYPNLDYPTPRLQNFVSHTHITKATRVSAIAKSCKMAFSNRQKQRGVPKMYWLSKQKLDICKFIATDSSYTAWRSTTVAKSSKKMADTGKFHLSEQICLSEHFSNLPWPKVFG